ncbi:MAG: carbamoyltransferase HypF, partial [Planctomycetota bacterium]
RSRVTIDTATCPSCLRELRDPADRRFHHAFVNCVSCGPRYTIVTDLPYDRPNTTMAGFAMCDACAVEYADPSDRRFHAQPVCCPDCGPRLTWTGSGGGDPIDAAAAVIRDGGIVAVKGLGGFHLAVDATGEAAVLRLRVRKRRDAKPFAIMVADLDSARRLADLSPAGEAALASPESPIVLAPRRESAIAEGVTKGSHRVGIMFPCTPVQHLLLAAVGRPLVMTSGNVTDDPLVSDDDEAARDLGGIADAFLGNDRPIERAIDDSIVIDGPEGLLPIRRARGMVPAPLALPIAAPRPGLAAGGELKGAVALVREGEAILGPHLGDLTWARAWRRFERTVADLERLYDVRPTWIAADEHPDYRAHRYAARRSRADGIDLVLVQHHHAHLASLLAEHGRTDRILGIVADGVGYGGDGTAWGGEVLAADLGGYERLGRLRPLRMPGGDVAAKEITRLADAWRADIAGEELPAGPDSSGLGRLFDAAAAVTGLATENRYEAMSGILLEAAVGDPVESEGLVRVVDGSVTSFELDHRPLLARMERDDPVAVRAAAFHEEVAAGFAAAAVRAREETGLPVVGLTGGCFANTRLTASLARRLRDEDFEVLLHRLVPPNDGGIAYGQAAVAAAVLSEGA